MNPGAIRTCSNTRCFKEELYDGTTEAVIISRFSCKFCVPTGKMSLIDADITIYTLILYGQGIRMESVSREELGKGKNLLQRCISKIEGKRHKIFFEWVLFYPVYTSFHLVK